MAHDAPPALRAEWYAKAAGSGFHDIEVGVRDGTVRRVHTSDADGRASYFEQAATFLATYDCADRVRQILELHVQGLSKDAIIRALDGDTGRRPSGAARRRVKRAI